MNKYQSVPLAVLKIAAIGHWKTTEYNLSGYEECRLGHLKNDQESGGTCAYAIKKNFNLDYQVFSYNELQKILKYIPEDMWSIDDEMISINQHAIHSLSQFMCNVQDQWDKHLERMESLPTYQTNIWKHCK